MWKGNFNKMEIQNEEELRKRKMREKGKEKLITMKHETLKQMNDESKSGKSKVNEREKQNCEELR